MSGPKEKAKAKAKTKTVKEQAQAWRQIGRSSAAQQEEGQEGEEEENKSDDPVVAVEKRGFGKARKFSRMMQAGSIPEDIRRLYEEGSKTAKSPRLFKTELINRMFTVGKDGTYVLCTDSPEFKSWRRNVDTRFATAESVGVPYSIMLWQIFQGNEQAMLQAERKGDIYESEGMFHHRKVSAGRTKTSSDDLELSGGAVKLKVDEFSEMSKWLGTREWSKFGNSMLTAAEEEKDGLRTKGQLCLQDVQTPGSFNPGGLSSSARPTKTVKLPWDKVLPTVSEAQAANDRLHRDCSRMVMKVRGGDPDLVTKIKETMAELTSNMGKLGDCQMWEEVPGSEGNEKSKVESFFAAIAQSTERANENLEQLKALCKARGL